jgi:phosphatidylserine/phosphatidylglycerophosphate/cardiolipin synthase-like enzyme
MRDLNSGLPIGDTNTSSDWAQSRVDPVRGRRVQYPGWDLDTFFFTRRITETAEVVIGIAPDNAFDLVNGEIENANESLLIATHTFRNHAIANTLVKAAERGVSVTVLMEGNPVQGIDDQQKLICKSLEAAGGQCWFMISDSDRKIYDRYTYYHAKYMLIDGRRVIISTENLSPDSLPDDDKDDGTWGRRGLVFVTNAPGIVDHIGNLWLADFDPINHSDLYRWTASHPKYGLPPPSTIPISQTGGDQYAIRYQTPFTYQGQFTFEVIQSPENSLRSNDSLLGLLSQAGPDDVVLVQQLEEYPYWGSKSSNPTEDPNPRLLAYIDAARRGAKVRLLLDGYFGNGSDVKSNQATCRLVNNIAIVENLDLICRLGNPTGLGIHNKMILVQVKGLGFVHLGSLNGSEQASKGNREVAIQFQIDLAYADLSEMFYFDWPKRYYLPIVFVDG